MQFIFPPVFPRCSSCADGRAGSADGIIIAVTYLLLTGGGEHGEPDVLPLLAQLFAYPLGITGPLFSTRWKQQWFDCRRMHDLASGE